MSPSPVIYARLAHAAVEYADRATDAITDAIRAAAVVGVNLDVEYEVRVRLIKDAAPQVSLLVVAFGSAGILHTYPGEGSR